MRITWFGHACFKLLSDSGVSVITDPFDENVGYDLPGEKADIVTVSHQHYDHNFIEAVKGTPEIISEAGDFHVNNIRIKGVRSFHDDEGGRKRGFNIKSIDFLIQNIYAVLNLIRNRVIIFFNGQVYKSFNILNLRNQFFIPVCFGTQILYLAVYFLRSLNVIPEILRIHGFFKLFYLPFTA